MYGIIFFEFMSERMNERRNFRPDIFSPYGLKLRRCLSLFIFYGCNCKGRNLYGIRSI
jgi:hypothetical protein